MKADLHIHTNFSDGKYSVEEVLDIALASNINIISITDHDTFEGSKVAVNMKKDLRIIIGIELSTVRNNENVHILGYFKNENQINIMQPFLDKQILRRDERAYQILEKLKVHFNIDLNSEFIEKTRSVTRGTIAREIIRQGYDYTNAIIFKYMIGEGCPAYVPSSKLRTIEGIKLIQECGGLAVLAHPMHLKYNDPKDIIDLGINGLEVKYPCQDEQKYRKIADENNLFITAGTDFHDFHDERHGNIGDKYLEGDDLSTFLKVLYEL